jgi:integrase
MKRIPADYTVTKASKFWRDIYSEAEMKTLAEFFVENRNTNRWWNPLGAVGMVLFGAGLRKNELQNLLIEDCIIDPVPLVRVWTGKGKVHAREVVILPEFRQYYVERLDLLRALQQINSSITHYIPRRHDGTGHMLFKGGPCSSSTLTGYFLRVAQAVGFDMRESHAFRRARRTWATYMVRSRWQLEDGNWSTISAWDAAAQMGHSSLAYLQEYYDKGPAQMRIPIDQRIEWR